jgi:hypothetical protein
MKKVEEMNLAECLEFLREYGYDFILTEGNHELADRIHDLNRWISVDERWPETEDVFGKVLVYSNCGRYWKVIDTPQQTLTELPTKPVFPTFKDE